jgi:anti-sigma B factor antagonist
MGSTQERTVLAVERPALDLSDVTYFGSAGLAVLVESAEDAAQRSTAMHPLRVVVDQTRPVIRPLQISGVQSCVRLHHHLGRAP